MEILEDWKRRGYRFRVKCVRGKLYLTAYRKVNGRFVEKSLGRISDKQLAILREKGYVKTSSASKTSMSNYKTHSNGNSSNSTNTTTRTSKSFKGGAHGDGGVGGSWPCFSAHRLYLRSVRNDVAALYLGSYGFRFDSRNKQRVRRYPLGRNRWVTVQVNRDGSAQVYLAADSNPLDIWEFIAFCKGVLPFIFKQLTGKDVSLKDFIVMTAPEPNIDLPGVKILEGVKSLTLEDYYGDVVRVYFKEYSNTMPNGGTRVEVIANSWKGVNLEDLANGLKSMVQLPRTLIEIKNDLELIKSSLPKQQLEAAAPSDVVSTKLANLLYLLFEKFLNRLKPSLKEMLLKIDEFLKPFKEKIVQLERENQELKAKLRELTNEDSKLEFNDLPSNLKGFLKEMERDGYIRLTETRISYGDKVWQAIFRRRCNIDWWIEEESYNYYRRRNLFKAVLKAITMIISMGVNLVYPLINSCIYLMSSYNNMEPSFAY